MKILAAVMDITFVKYRKPKGYYIHKVKKCLVYDPRKVVIRKNDDERAKQIR